MSTTSDSLLCLDFVKFEMFALVWFIPVLNFFFSCLLGACIHIRVLARLLVEAEGSARCAALKGLTVLFWHVYIWQKYLAVRLCVKLSWL